MRAACELVNMNQANDPFVVRNVVTTAIQETFAAEGIPWQPTAGTPEADYAAAVKRAYGTEENYFRYCRAAQVTPEHVAMFTRAGVVLQPKQLNFSKLARECDFPNGPEEVGIGGARGGSKSYGVFSQISLDDSWRCPGLKSLFLRNTARSATEQLEDLASRILRHVPDAEIKKGRVDFGNGSRIIIGGFSDDRSALSYLGQEYDVIAVEEATQISPKAHELIRASNRSSKFDIWGRPWRPRRYFTTNPLGIGHQFFKKRFVDNERLLMNGLGGNPRHRFIFSRVDDNVFINPEYVGVLDEMTGVEYKAYRLGDWNIQAGAYFENFNEKIHVIPQLRDISWMRDVWMSMDFGFNHWNMAYLHGEDGDGIKYTIHEFAHRKMRPKDIVADIYRVLHDYGLVYDDLRSFLAGGDVFARTGTSDYTVAEQYAQEGITLDRAEVAAGSRVGRALYLNNLLGDASREIEPRWFISSQCIRLIECIPALEMDPNNPEDIKKWDADVNGDGGDDPIDGAGYGLYNPRRSEMG
jgi:phage terminase large subunit